MSDLALITGAAGGLGQAVAKRLADDGWQLALVGRDAATLQAAYGDDHLQIVADCSTTAGVTTVFQRLQATGRVAVALAHCVGNIRLSPLHRMREADFNDCLNANLISAFHTLAGFVGALRVAQQPGAAVLVSSVAARIGTPNHEAIAAAKAGVEGLVRGAAASYAPAGIRINAVAPGIMATPAAKGILANPASRDAAARLYPLPGIGEPAELAELMAWLLSSHAARVTGQTWALDAGFSTIRPLVRSA